MGGLHSGETGPSEMLMELVYRLATETSPIITQIRNNLYVSIPPVADADGVAGRLLGVQPGTSGRIGWDARTGGGTDRRLRRGGGNQGSFLPAEQRSASLNQTLHVGEPTPVPRPQP